MASSATVGVNVTLTDPDTGLTVQGIGSLVASLSAGIGVNDIILPAATANLSLPFPHGVVTAQVAFIKAVSCTDLTVKLSTAAGSTVHSVPKGAAQVFYGVAALYASSALGGTVQYSIGG